MMKTNVKYRSIVEDSCLGRWPNSGDLEPKATIDEIKLDQTVKDRLLLLVMADSGDLELSAIFHEKN